MRNKLMFLVLVSLLVSASVAPAQSSPRQRILFDDGWRFHSTLPPVLINQTQVTTWRWKADNNGPTDAATVAAPGYDTSSAGWADTQTGVDVFGGQQGYAWYVTTLPDFSGPRQMLVRADDNADVYINGQKVAHHEGWNSTFNVPLEGVWKSGQVNTLAILVYNVSGAGGVTFTAYGQPADPTSAISGDPSTPQFDDTKWRTVHVPHDYIVEGTFTPAADPSHGSLPTEAAWYRKSFTLPTADKGKSVWIDFDGVYRDSVVYLNGTKLGEWPSGYAPFRYDISNVANFGGTNVLAVSVDPTAQEGWWYEGGGIYRHVWLNVANPIHVAPFGTYVQSSLAEPVPGQPVPPATLTIQTTVVSPTESNASIRVSSELLGPAGTPVLTTASPVTLSSPSQVVTQTVTLAHPILWSIDQPNLYTLKTLIYQGANVIDSYSTPFGVRTVRFDPNKGFFLNGVSVKIKGTCNHQDFAGVGIAVTDSLESWRVKILKGMGSNGWRTSHNPPNTSLLDACDQEGMVVMDENRHLGDTTSPKTPSGTTFTDPTELNAMILRDRNHPSVIMWSLCNEEPLQGDPEGQKIFKAMMDDVHTLDTTRPISCAMSGGYNTLNGFSGVEDLQGINYGPGNYSWFHFQHPTMPVFGSETASTVSTRGVYTQDTFKNDYGTFTGVAANGWVSAYDQNRPGWAQTAHDSWAPQAEQDFVAGGFAWTGFDYKGEPTPFGWPDINSNFGIVDECGFPKDGYYYYKAWWTAQPVVHVFPHWNWAGKEGQPILVWVYSNAAMVDLAVNGVSLGKQSVPANGHVEWNVPYAPGTVVANGYDATGKLIATDEVQTTGDPASIKLVPDRSKLFADGEDDVPVEVDILDSKGLLVPTAGNKITFTVSGAGINNGVGNGNPSDHDPDKANFRSAYCGKALINVLSTNTPGTITLTATSPGLATATITLKSVAGSSIDPN